MKKLILFAFTLFAFSSFGQKNEIIYSISSFNNDFIKESTLSYYRNISNRQAIGLKTNFKWNIVDERFYKSEFYEGNLDLVHRQNFLKSNKFRLLGEFGMSVKRTVQHHVISQTLCICGTGPFDTYQSSITNSGWVRTNHLGFTTGLGFDVQFLKRLRLGATFSLRKYFINDSTLIENIEEKKLDSNFNFNLGVNF